MPRPAATNAAQNIVHEASSSTTELLAGWPNPSQNILETYSREDWQDRPVVRRRPKSQRCLKLSTWISRLPILVVLRKASEAGKPVGVA
jgi:hypothetical protein